MLRLWPCAVWVCVAITTSCLIGVSLLAIRIVLTVAALLALLLVLSRVSSIPTKVAVLNQGPPDAQPLRVVMLPLGDKDVQPYGSMGPKQCK